MKDAMILLCHLLAVISKLLRPGSERIIVAEILLPKQQLLLHSRSRSRAPNLSTRDRLLYSSDKKGKPGPKDPSREVIDVIVPMKERANNRCQRAIVPTK